MSLTDTDVVYAAIHEDGANDFLTAFCTARPHYLNYRSSTLISVPPAAASAWTLMSPIPFPGLPGGVHWAVQFSCPVVDFFPDSTGGGMPPPLTLSAGELSVRTAVRLTLLCGVKRRPKGDSQSGGVPLQTKLDVWGVGEPVAHYFGPGTGDITFELHQVEIVDITPDTLESLLECLIRMLLSAVLADIHLPFKAIDADVFTLDLTRGPTVEDDQVKVWGNIV